MNKYFEYCKKGNIEAVYFCIMEGVDPDQVNLNDKNRNAFFYACENNHKEML